ncbi:hypothetical protein WP5W18E06_30820 [Klebsiella quasipneumoniae]|nr:hypothetical protein WP5W18E06_30820 [Klebsiella quasipneumoniae]
MKKLTALFVASTLALGAANLAHAADTTTAPSDSKPMMHHHGGMAREVLINVFIHIDFTHFLILSSAHMAPGKTPLNPHKPINL